MRNRIVSGLAQGTDVISAGEMSGATITAVHALEQHRELFVVPGQLHDPLARGTNKLLKDNCCHLTEGANDVLLGLGFEQQAPNVDPRPPLVARRTAREPLTGLAAEIECYLDQSLAPRTFDDIVIDGGFDARAAMAVLGRLEAGRRVARTRGGGYVLTD
jgi:DNA processing protein